MVSGHEVGMRNHISSTVLRQDTLPVLQQGSRHPSESALGQSHRSAHLDRLKGYRNKRQRQGIILSSAEKEEVKRRLTIQGFKPSSLRPGGHMRWLKAGLDKAVIHK